MFNFERERDLECEQGRGREPETQNPKQAPASELSVQSPMVGLEPTNLKIMKIADWALKWLGHPGATKLFHFFKSIFNYYFFFLRESGSLSGGGVGREEGKESQAGASSQCRAWRGARTQEVWVHDLSWSRMLNWQSYPDAPHKLFQKELDLS